MAARLPKFRPGLVNMAVLIFLSGSALSETQCYWCGPLADQVHRSQRSPPCGRYRATTCDPGYNYCATVVTEPPYAESRLCVKFYQDECYSLYCNSTKTWRMVCACKGNLCNGPHTERETKAFATMAKKNKRVKRALIASFISVKTKTPSDNNTLIIINKTDAVNQVEELENEKHPKHEVVIEHGAKKVTEEQNSDPYDRVNRTTTVATTERNTEAKIDQAETTVKVETTNEVTPTMKVEKTTTEVTVKPTTVKEPVSKTSDKLPPPEALQHDVTPTKPMEVTTMALETTETNEIATKVNATKKNRGEQNLAHFLLISMVLVLHFSL